MWSNGSVPELISGEFQTLDAETAESRMAIFCENIVLVSSVMSRLKREWGSVAMGRLHQCLFNYRETERVKGRERE